MYDLFSEFFNGFDYFTNPASYKEQIKCPVCGRTYSDFSKSGRLGCGQCYDTFRTQLSLTMKQLHQNPVHAGKIPSNSNDAIKKKHKYESLKNQLAQAVRDEDYETAARIHKELKSME